MPCYTVIGPRGGCSSYWRGVNALLAPTEADVRAGVRAAVAVRPTTPSRPSRSFSAKPEVTEPLLSLKKKVCHSISLGWREICISHPIQPSPLSRFFLSRERMGRHIIPT